MVVLLAAPAALAGPGGGLPPPPAWDGELEPKVGELAPVRSSGSVRSRCRCLSTCVAASRFELSTAPLAEGLFQLVVRVLWST